MTAGTSFDYRVALDGMDIAGMVLAGATITYGSTSQGQPPSPTTAHMELVTVDAAGDLAATYPGISWNVGIPSGYVDTFGDTYEGALSALNVGATLSIRIATDSGYVDRFDSNYRAGFDVTRFTGIITALDYTPALIGITAVDLAEQLNRVQLDPATWPGELELERVTRILTEVGVTGSIHGTSSVPIRAGSHSSKRTAWKHLVDLATSCGSIVWIDREGALTYRTAGALPDTTYLAPPDATLQDPLKMSSELGDVINAVEVTWGAAQVVTAQDTASVTKYGRREGKLELELDDPVDAQLFADEYVTLHAAPAWHMPNATVHLGLANTDGQIAKLLNVDLDDVLELPYLLPASPVTSYASRVLGYSEVLDPNEWLITYVLDPYGWSSP